MTASCHLLPVTLHGFLTCPCRWEFAAVSMHEPDLELQALKPGCIPLTCIHVCMQHGMGRLGALCQGLRWVGQVSCEHCTDWGSRQTQAQQGLHMMSLCEASST